MSKRLTRRRFAQAGLAAGVGALGDRSALEGRRIRTRNQEDSVR